MGRDRSGGDDSHVFIHGTPQHEFLFDGERLLVRHLMRLDDPQFFPKLCLAVGVILLKLELANASTGVSSYINRSDARRILKIYGNDYDLMDSVSVCNVTASPSTLEEQSD